MKIDQQILKAAVKENIISVEQSDKLWGFIKKYSEENPSFNFTHVLYYFGGLVAITAMSLFMTLGWETLGGYGIFFISIAYMIAGLWVTNYLFRKNLNIPGGIIATFVIALTPLAIYGLQKGLGYWPEQYNYRDYHTTIRGLWMLMELGTLAFAAILFYIYRRPFMILPIAVTLWYLSMDLTPFLFNVSETSQYKSVVSIVVGLLMLLLAFIIDVRNKSRHDYAFHLYLYGMLAFWGGMTSSHSDNEWNKFIYCLINILLIFVGVIINRRVFSIFGALGVFVYLSYLSYSVFKDSILFPIVLSLIGFGIIYLGILWNKNEKHIRKRLLHMIKR